MTRTKKKKTNNENEWWQSDTETLMENEDENQKIGVRTKSDANTWHKMHSVQEM